MDFSRIIRSRETRRDILKYGVSFRYSVKTLYLFPFRPNIKMLSRLQSRQRIGNRWKSASRITAPFQVCFHEGIVSLVMTELAVLITSIFNISKQHNMVAQSRFETHLLFRNHGNSRLFRPFSRFSDIRHRILIFDKIGCTGEKTLIP